MEKIVIGRDIVSDTLDPDHFLKKVFARKEGGTKLGNALRQFASEKTGGILGSGAMLKKTPVINTSAIKTDREKLISATKQALKKSVDNLPESIKQNLKLTDANMLPKTKALVDAEKEVITVENTPKPKSLSFSPYLIVGLIIGVIVLIFVANK